MSASRAENIKEAGNEALRKGDYNNAISLYTRAIELDCYNPKLYSNRCTAYLYLHEYDSAIQDAKKCVSLDPDWGKGHVQMGSCYTSLHQYEEAIKEYKKALPLVDNRSVIEELIKNIELKMHQNSLSSLLFGDASRILYTLKNFLVLLLFLCTVGQLLPLGRRFQIRCSSVFLSCYVCVLLIHVYLTFGRPSFSTEYLSRLLRDSLLCYAIPYGIFSNTPYISMVRILILSNQFIPFFEFFYSRILVPLSSSMAQRVENAMNQAMLRLLGSAWQSRNPTEKRYILTELVEMGNGSMELMLLLASILMVRGLKGILMVILTFQYLMFRVSSNPYLERVVRQLDTTMNQLVYHPRCPMFIRDIYLKVREFIIRRYYARIRVCLVC